LRPQHICDIYDLFAPCINSLTYLLTTEAEHRDLTSVIQCGQSYPVASTGMSSYLSKLMPVLQLPNSSLSTPHNFTAHDNAVIMSAE